MAAIAGFCLAGDLELALRCGLPIATTDERIER
jgi:enoyl-CoA hydratase/carnithine racemase